MAQTETLVARAREIADEVLWPAALAVDRSGALPASHFDALAAAGLYGVGDTSVSVVSSIAEALAGGCLATAFVWIQHHGSVRSLAAPDAPAALRHRWLEPLRRGQRRAGVALAGLLPGPPRLTARPERRRWVLDGEAPWVTGWGLVDSLLVVARYGEREVGWFLVEGLDDERLVAEPLHLVAVDASRTVRLGSTRWR